MADGNAASASEAGCRKDGGKTVVIAFDGSDYAKHAMKCKYRILCYFHFLQI